MEPPDPMFTKDTPTIERIKWWAVALMALPLIGCRIVWDKVTRGTKK